MLLPKRSLMQILALLPLGSTITVRAEDSSYIYFDNTQYLADTSNVVSVSWSALKAAFASPNRTDTAKFEGLDWTKPYPGSALAGFSANLRIADDVPFPSEATTENVLTNVAALTFGIPRSLVSNGLPKAMDPSWYICQHFFVSNVPDPTKDVDDDCSFLPKACQTDLVNSLVDSWGSLYSRTAAMCGANALDRIAPSCRDAVGATTADVLASDHSDLENAVTAKALTVDEVQQYSWMIGTGFHESRNQTSYYDAYNRTYITVNVFGYNSQVTGAAKPLAKLACLRPKWTAPPGSSTSTTSSTATSRTSTSVTATGSLTSSATTTSAEPTGSGTTSTSSVASTTSENTSSASPTSTVHCLGGTIANGISGNLLGICSYGCDFDHCLSSACVCTSSAAAAVAAPTPVAGNTAALIQVWIRMQMITSITWICASMCVSAGIVLLGRVATVDSNQVLCTSYSCCWCPTTCL
ncbi:hypothetical protein GE09DRAFT_1120102 [Coniochaeta sp. 2T2.1]|nr:hypothetical protein GE09DRAFT_1120102 [Coniochaeta sp. 2T2.1]